MSIHSADYEVDSDQYISYSPTSFVDGNPQIGANSEERLPAAGGGATTGQLVVDEEVHVISSDDGSVASIRATSELLGFSDDSALAGQSITSTSVGGKKRPSSEASNVEVKKPKSCSQTDDSNIATVPAAHSSQAPNAAIVDAPISHIAVPDPPVPEFAVSEAPISNVFTLPNIVEVSSNSTSNTLRQERNARYKNWQTMTPPRHLHVKQLASRSETSSDLPNSSQSNDDVPNKYGIRPTLLKGTAPGDSFELELAMLASERPQMSLDEKMGFWQCPSELSDVEDVNCFDDLFRQQEEAKRKAKRDSSLSVLADVPNEKPMDFESFCKQLKNTAVQALQQQPVERPTTSAAARAAMTKIHCTRLLPASMDKSELSPQKRSQNSTSPPATSSSENSVNRYVSLKKRLQKLQANEAATCQSSTEETSTDENDIRRHHMMLTEKRNSFAKRAGAAGIQRMADTAVMRSQSEAKDDTEVCQARSALRTAESKPLVLAKTKSATGQHSFDPPYLVPVSPKRSEMTLTPYSSLQAIDRRPSSRLVVNNSNANMLSIFRTRHSTRNKGDEDPKCLIQARLDSTSQQKQQQLKEKKSELFKTPMVPQPHCQTTNGTDDQLEEGVHAERDRSIGKFASIANVPGFHQQHEFCNYLGLTNMSTATAVANAVAELAKCSMKRRSLRVHQQRQQERRDKSAKAASEAQLQATRAPTDQKHVQQPKSPKEKQPHDAHQRLKGGQELEEKLINKAGVERELAEKDLGIKIVCQIAASSRKDLEHLPKDCARRISQDVVPHVRKWLQEPGSTNTDDEAPMKPEMIKREPLGRAVKEAYDGPASTTRSKQNRSYSLRSVNSEKKWNIRKPEQEKPHEKVDEHPEALRERQRKFQQFLEESRQHKPAIFIVKSMQSQDEVGGTSPKADKVATPLKNNAVIPSSPQVSPKIKPFTRASTKSPAKNKPMPVKILEKNGVPPARRMSPAKPPTTRRTALKISLSNNDLASRLRGALQPTLANGAAKDRSARTRLQLTRSQLLHIPKGKRRSAKIVVYKQYVRANSNSKTVLQQLSSRSRAKLAAPAKLEPPLNNGPIIATVELDPVVKQIEAAPQTPQCTDKSTATERLKRHSIETTVPVKPATKNATTQCEVMNTMKCLSQPQHTSWKLPLSTVHGAVVYMFYELDVLIVVQEQCISFWKYSKLINILAVTREPNGAGDADLNASMEWILLGECKRKVKDIEVKCPFNNRMCQNNSMPVYLEMRCFVVPRGARRECNLVHLYMNVYYYNEEDLQVKAHSIHLDAVQTIPTNVTYTTLPESRYFVMSWLQENAVGKVCNGMCKYSLTPALDTLASIREFKNLRHEICSLDCIQDDKLVGFGHTQLTIWDHRSGDVIMNYDLEAPIGRSLGNIYFPSADLGHNNMLVLFQYRQNELKEPELVLIACSISCSSPSYRILQRVPLPTPAFSFICNSINTSEHLIITAQNNEELWISCTSPNWIASVPALKTRRFYARGRTQVLEISKEQHGEGIDTYHLTVDSISNYLLKLATAQFLPQSSQG